MSELPKHVIDFAQSPVEPVVRDITDPAIVEAPYQSTSWRHFVNEDKQFISGIWQAGTHKEFCDCDYDELCHILEGTVRLTDEHGVTREFGAGATFVVARGFKGTWENLTDVRKVFVILG